MAEIPDGVRRNPTPETRPNGRELWHRLHADPEVKRSLREHGVSTADVLGPRPVGSNSGRFWGDGAHGNTPHVVEEISFSDGWFLCRCGMKVTPFALTLEQAWDQHRGIAVQAPSVHQAEHLATDQEVHEFLSAIDEWGYISEPVRE
jgi:hypothetical protein